ncbi:MAG: ribosome small subunit-dependent GTPase A [Clostridia bacterium]|nr:ribosome small subunit-dependent GTPase A [Clostridia bacterium]
MADLTQYGWNESMKAHYETSENKENSLGRVIADFGYKLKLITEEGETLATVAPRLLQGNGQIRPAAGDWVIFKKFEDQTEPMILEVLPRKTKFSRAAAGIEVKEQVVAANVDVVFLMQSLNQNFNLRRLERYLIAAWESGALPVIVLTKSDICDDTDTKLSQVYEVAKGVDIFAVSAVTGEGLDKVKAYITPGKTVAFLGSSGVGKSTLVNSLSGKELLKTQEVREDDARGRHTTTHRELDLLPDGGVVLDTPGMRTLTLWEAEEGIAEVFGDIEELVKECRFSDCKHQNEPGCAVRAALQNGSLSEKRWENWLKLQKELLYIEGKRNFQVREERKKFQKAISRNQRSVY